ncbi:MAG: hypothetical protein KME43_26060 [Myxacorys chilensis ATA2-1-KO14]|jgi:hypothetical protein|nr:hypothetical protein [Myxacorys chilensis ATA2-1-KO14]
MPTIEVTAINDLPVVSAIKAREVLNVRHRLTFNADRAALNLQHTYHFTQPELIELFKLRLWLSARPGVNSREAFKRYRTQPALLKLKFQQCGVDLDREIQHFTQQLP